MTNPTIKVLTSDSNNEGKNVSCSRDTQELYPEVSYSLFMLVLSD